MWSKERDRARSKIAKKIEKLGWLFVILWEHELKSGSSYARIKRLLENRYGYND
jgi:G:T-mismatch repair DNA endonuclease (very short patch repair protein)